MLTLEATIRRLERTLVHEGGNTWRAIILGGGPADLDWPVDMPPLTTDLKTWFAWRSTSDLTVVRDQSWRSVSWAVEQYRACATDPHFRQSLVPILEHVFVDVEDGSVWARTSDDDGLERFEREPFPDLSGFLASMESAYAARRRSPWRRFRVDRMDCPPWSRLEAVPEREDLERLAGCAVMLPKLGEVIARPDLVVPDGVFVDGVFVDDGDGLRFVMHPVPTNADVLAILDRIMRRVARRLADEANDLDAEAARSDVLEQVQAEAATTWRSPTEAAHAAVGAVSRPQGLPRRGGGAGDGAPAWPVEDVGDEAVTQRLLTIHERLASAAPDTTQ